MALDLVFSGMACGMLLVVLGMTIWSAQRPQPQISRIATIIQWTTGASLLIGALVVGRHDVRFAALSILAALVALPLNGTPRRSVGYIVPSALLTGLTLVWAITLHSACVDGISPTVLMSIAIAGGLSAHVLGPAGAKLQHNTWAKAGENEEDEEYDTENEGGRERARKASMGTGQTIHTAPRWPASAAFVILTLTIGGIALVNLWQWGTVWSRPAQTSNLVGMWLAWGAAWMAPRRPWWLRAALYILALTLLVITITCCF